jgi:predicted nucleic acid-binding protein
VILVDTNVLLDLLRADSPWQQWSEQQLAKQRQLDLLAINVVIYAELTANPDAAGTIDALLDVTGIRLEAFSKASARLAGRAFYAYRKRKGVKLGVLPDFFIGAQAQAEGWTILTRDVARYTTYFPDVALISPQSS